MKFLRPNPKDVAICASALLLASSSRADPAPLFTGDVGLGVSWTQPAPRGARLRVDPIPYLDIESGPLFVRLDTAGVKTVKLGDGTLDFVGQYRTDGYSSTSLGHRPDSIPLGLGTLQITPWGGILINALHDFGPSHGQLFEASYFPEFNLGRLSLNPEVGLEWQSANYTRYYFDFGANGVAATNPVAGLLAQFQLDGPWYLTAYARASWIDAKLRRAAPDLRNRAFSDFVAVSYRF